MVCTWFILLFSLNAFMSTQGFKYEVFYYLLRSSGKSKYFEGSFRMKYSEQ